MLANYRRKIQYAWYFRWFGQTRPTLTNNVLREIYYNKIKYKKIITYATLYSQYKHEHQALISPKIKLYADEEYFFPKMNQSPIDLKTSFFDWMDKEVFIAFFTQSSSLFLDLHFYFQRVLHLFPSHVNPRLLNSL